MRWCCGVVFGFGGEGVVEEDWDIVYFGCFFFIGIGVLFVRLLVISLLSCLLVELFKDIDFGLEFLEVLRILLCINIELFDVLVLGWWWWLLEFFKFIWFFMLFLMLVGVNCIWCGEVLFLVFCGLIIGWLKNDFWSFIFGKFFVNWGV